MTSRIIGFLIMVFLSCSTLRAEQKLANEQGQTVENSPNDGYVAIAMDGRKTISGKSLLIASYTVIFGVLLLYVYWLWRRERSISSGIDALQRTLTDPLHSAKNENKDHKNP